MEGGILNIQQEKLCVNEFFVYIGHQHGSTHSYQNVNLIVNRFLIFSYRISYYIVYHKIHKHLIKFIKNYKYTYIKDIFIINFEYIQLMTNFFYHLCNNI